MATIHSDSSPEVETQRNEEEDLIMKGNLLRERLALKAKKNLIFKKTPGVSQLAQAMRFIICNFMKNSIENGHIISKFFPQFIICDIISPKCFVVLPKNNIALTIDGKARKLIFKVLNSDDIQTGCGMQNPTDKQISGMIDDWIYMAPQSPNIVNAYEVFKDYLFYMQLTEYCEEYDNLYNTIKQMKLSSLQDQIPRELVRLIYLYIIQISHAFMNAHKSNLCHGDFNLSQVICDRTHDNFKVVNFRPWLVQKLQRESSIDGQPIFSKKELINIAKARDLSQFGESIYDLMVGKTSREDVVKQVIVEQRTMASQSQMSNYSTQQFKTQKKMNMPSLENIPLVWVKSIEGTCLFEIIHMCMVINVNRNTVDLFQQIHKIASQQYARFFDAQFKPFRDIKHTSDIVRNRDFAIGLNNRSVMTRFKILTHGLNRVVSESENQQVLNFQQQLLEQACQMAYHCDESQLNLCLLKWQRGQLFDDDFCREIYTRMTEHLAAQYVCLMFRRGIGLSINKQEEKLVLQQQPREAIGVLISDQYKEFSLLKMETAVNFEVHLAQIIKDPSNQSVKGGIQISKAVKKIFFSSNEKFCVLITENIAVVLRITFNNFQVLGQVNLPQYNKPVVQSPKVPSFEPSSKFDSAAQSPMNSIGVSESQTDVNTSILSSPMTMSAMPMTPGSGLLETKETEMDTQVDEAEQQRLEKEEHQEQRKKRVLCNGYFNSPWTAAIDNKGKILVLHHVEQVQIVKRTAQDDNIDYLAEQTGSLLTCDKETQRIYPGMKFQSQITILSGNKFTKKKVVEIGRVCPDEILDITFDKEDPEPSNAMEDLENILENANNQSKKDFSGENTPLLRDSQAQMILKKQTSFEGEIKDTAAFNIVDTDPVIHQNYLNQSPTLGQEIEPLLSGTQLNSNPQLTLQSQFSFVNQEQSFVIEVKCKNLLKYTLDIKDVLMDKIDHVILVKEPTVLSGGAAIPVSIFNNPNGTKKEKVIMEKYEKIKNMTSLLVQKHSLTSPTYKLKHYDHLKEFIQKQEAVGNIIKFAKNNNQYLIGYQHQEYKGRGPHFFVYDILMRKVVRRFLAMSAPFSLFQTFDSAVEVNCTSDHHHNLGSKNKSMSIDSDETPKKEQEEDEIGVSEVINFEVSPNGSFMIQVVDPELLVLKLLNPAILEVFRDNLQPGYFSQDLDKNVFDDVKKMRDGSDCSDGDNTPMHGNNFFKSSHRFSIKTIDFDREAQIKEMQTVDQNNPVNKMKIIDDSRPLSSQLIQAHQDFELYIGSTYQKHLKFIKFHTLVAACLENPEKLVNPGAALKVNTATTESDLLSPVSEKSDVVADLAPMKQKILQQMAQMKHEKEIEMERKDKETTVPGGVLSSRLLKKCFFAIQEFHYHYSILQETGQITAGVPNLFSQKIGVSSLRKFTTFDSIAFRHQNDTIKTFQMCSLPNNWMFAVYYSRVLQIYDQTTGAQIFELCVPSAKAFAMIDNEQLILAQDGLSTVYIATIECQRKAFISKGTAQKKVDAVTVQEYEENVKISEYELGLSHQRQRVTRQYSDHSESDNEEENEYGGIKKIKWDQDIIEMVTARNVAAFGFFALIGKSKISIFSAYADEEFCIYDEVWTIEFISLLGLGIGLSIKLLDFSTNCESFCGYTNIGYICTWDIKRLNLQHKVYLVPSQDRPISKIRSVNNNAIIVTYSRQTNLIMIINAHAIQSMQSGTASDHVLKIYPGAEGFGHVVNFQVDNSEQFLICAFTRSKLAVYSMKIGSLLATIEDTSMVCEGSFIDETGCYMATIDESRKFVNIYTFEWNYKVLQPSAPKPKKTKEDQEEIKRKQEEERKAKELAAKMKEEAAKKTKSCNIF